MGRNTCESSHPIDLLKSSELSGTTSSWIGFPSAPNLPVDLVTSSESLPIDFCHNHHPLPIQDISVLKVVRADQLIASITKWCVIILRGSIVLERISITQQQLLKVALGSRTRNASHNPSSWLSSPVPYGWPPTTPLWPRRAVLRISSADLSSRWQSFLSRIRLHNLRKQHLNRYPMPTQSRYELLSDLFILGDFMWSLTSRGWYLEWY